MSIYKCSVCDTEYDEEKEHTKWDQLSADWSCHVCESGKSMWQPVKSAPAAADSPMVDERSDPGYSDAPEKTVDEFESYMADIHIMAETGESIIEPMRTRKPTFSWDDILIRGAQLAKIPLNQNQAVNP